MRTPLAEPAERGRLDIHPTVLRKIVEHAADGVLSGARTRPWCVTNGFMLRVRTG